MDKDFVSKYIASVYWSFETVTTIGYGDISPQTLRERIFSLASMIIGVLMYSFVIANLSIMTSGYDARNEDCRVIILLLPSRD